MSEAVQDYPPYLDYPKPRKKQTNADKIRAMTDEELAIVLGDMGHDFPPYCKAHIVSGCDENCSACCVNWLKQEAPATPKREPICLTCAHANMSVTDDFADCLCKISGGYEGGKTECRDYLFRGAVE